MKTLASKLNNRIEIWGNTLIESPLGDSTEETLIKKVWADIAPTGGSLKNGDGNTEYSEVKAKIKIRKTDISDKNWIIYQGLRYDIDYILPNFDKNHYLDIFTTLNLE